MPPKKGKVKETAAPVEIPPSTNPNPNAKEMAAKIDETDEMKLKMLAALEKPEPGDVLYPPELNAHLIDQIKILTADGNELRKLIFTRESEIKELNKTVNELNGRIRDIISGSGPVISSKSAGVISAKIAELCKKNRHLIAEVECFKTKNANLERKVIQLDAINKEHDNLDVCLCKDDNTEYISQDEMKELNMKLANVNKRLQDSKMKNLELKNDIIAATKILQQELGCKFTNLKELTTDVMGWKGRAEKIVILQGKIKDLEDQLNVKKKEDKIPDITHTLKEMEAKRKREMDQAIKENKLLKEENQELKRKLEGAKCRVRNLECDSTLIRQKMQTFVEKSNADDQLINEQRNQIKTLEVYYQEILKDNTVKINKMQCEINEYQKLTQNTDAKVEALRRQANEKASKIEELRAHLLRYEECSLQNVFFTPMRTATDNEIKKLTALIITLNTRLDNERDNWEKLDATYRKTKEKKKKLEKKVTQLEEELIKLQESRRTSRLSRSSMTKDKDLPFEMGIGAGSLTKRKSSVGIVEKPSESNTTESEHTTSDVLDKGELKYRLELTEEKLRQMEDKLKMVEEEKQEDYNNFTEMIQTSKQLFNEALTVLQKEKCLCDNSA